MGRALCFLCGMLYFAPCLFDGQRKSKVTCENLQFVTVCPQFASVSRAIAPFSPPLSPVCLALTHFRLVFFYVSIHFSLWGVMRLAQGDSTAIKIGHYHDIRLKSHPQSKSLCTFKATADISLLKAATYENFPPVVLPGPFCTRVAPAGDLLCSDPSSANNKPLFATHGSLQRCTSAVVEHCIIFYKQHP